MDTTKLKRLPLSKLRQMAQAYGIAEAAQLQRKALLEALASLNEEAPAAAFGEAKEGAAVEIDDAALFERPAQASEMAHPTHEVATPSHEEAFLSLTSEQEAFMPSSDGGNGQELFGGLLAEQAQSATLPDPIESKPRRKRIRRVVVRPLSDSKDPVEAEAPTLSELANEGTALGGEISAPSPVEEAPPPEEVAPPSEEILSKTSPRLFIPELLEKLRISVQGVFVQPERQSHGYLRSALYNYHSSPDDVYVPAHLIRQYNLRWGDVVEGKVRLPRENERAYTLVEIERVNGLPPEYLRERRSLEHLTALFPTERFRLSEGTDDLTLRVIDLFAPIGKGQRGLIVAQPKTGKTIILQKIANAIIRNHPEVYMMVLLVDERPEEVTDFARNVPAEVVASTFDEEPTRQIELAETVIEKAKRLAETGLDVVVLMDSITRLARAYNHATPVSGRILTGGMDSAALHKPKRFFGAARKIEEGGSLTIVATALIDTGSKMDEVVFEEYKGTGNMELKLDRRLADRRIFPAINVLESGTRHEEALLEPEVLAKIWAIRKFLAELKPDEATEFLLDRMRHTRTNQEFLEVMSKWSP